MEEIKGRVFDIRRFSTHDGSGIRTTIFMQGCTLACAWCHNPEGIGQLRRPIWFAGKCIHCGTCLAKTAHAGLSKEGQDIKVHPEIEENWDAVIDACPTGALRWNDKFMSVDDAVKRLMRDEPFFVHGGGVTFSGGEPLLQKEFVLQTLKELKKRNVQTAIETALNVPWENVEAVIPYLDIIYADLKIMDVHEHQKYIGQENGQILANIKKLLQSSARERVIIRTPMIPGMTATAKNIREIAGYISGIYPTVRYELLNYNPLASAKYHLVDRKYCFEVNPKKYTAEQMQQFAQTAVSAGAVNASVES